MARTRRARRHNRSYRFPGLQPPHPIQSPNGPNSTDHLTAHQTQENAILRLGLDLGIYELLVNRNDAVTVDEVSKEVKADKQLMERVFRNLAAMGHVDEAGNGAYKANKVTRAFTTPKGVHLASFSYDLLPPLSLFKLEGEARRCKVCVLMLGAGMNLPPQLGPRSRIS